MQVRAFERYIPLTIYIHVPHNKKHSVTQTRNSPCGVPVYAPYRSVHCRINISKTVQIPTAKQYIYKCFLSQNTFYNTGRACQDWPHPVHIINLLIAWKSFRSPFSTHKQYIFMIRMTRPI